MPPSDHSDKKRSWANIIVHEVKSAMNLSQGLTGPGAFVYIGMYH